MLDDIIAILLRSSDPKSYIKKKIEQNKELIKEISGEIKILNDQIKTYEENILELLNKMMEIYPNIVNVMKIALLERVNYKGISFDVNTALRNGLEDIIKRFLERMVINSYETMKKAFIKMVYCSNNKDECKTTFYLIEKLLKENPEKALKMSIFVYQEVLREHYELLYKLTKSKEMKSYLEEKIKYLEEELRILDIAKSFIQKLPKIIFIAYPDPNLLNEVIREVILRKKIEPIKGLDFFFRFYYKHILGRKLPKLMTIREALNSLEGIENMLYNFKIIAEKTNDKRQRFVNFDLAYVSAFRRNFQEFLKELTNDLKNRVIELGVPNIVKTKNPSEHLMNLIVYHNYLKKLMEIDNFPSTAVLFSEEGMVMMGIRMRDIISSIIDLYMKKVLGKYYQRLKEDYNSRRDAIKVLSERVLKYHLKNENSLKLEW